MITYKFVKVGLGFMNKSTLNLTYISLKPTCITLKSDIEHAINKETLIRVNMQSHELYIIINQREKVK